MSQRNSGYQRIPDDAYETPAWVTAALVPHLPARTRHIWECAAGTGKLGDELRRRGFNVCLTDIAAGQDFLQMKSDRQCDGIVTNPPYSSAQKFIEHALYLTMPRQGFVAMLLRCDFDYAVSRTHLFRDCAPFALKLQLIKRIRWIEGSIGAPSFNHAWFLWDHQNGGSPIIRYGQ